MKIIHEQPDHRCDLSLAPIDLGFDPRLHEEMVCTIPTDAHIVGYEIGGESRIIEGTATEIIAELESAGYRICLEESVKNE